LGRSPRRRVAGRMQLSVSLTVEDSCGGDALQRRHLRHLRRRLRLRSEASGGRSIACGVPGAFLPAYRRGLSLGLWWGTAAARGVSTSVAASRLRSMSLDRSSIGVLGSLPGRLSSPCSEMEARGQVSTESSTTSSSSVPLIAARALASSSKLVSTAPSHTCTSTHCRGLGCEVGSELRLPPCERCAGRLPPERFVACRSVARWARA